MKEDWNLIKLVLIIHLEAYPFAFFFRFGRNFLTNANFSNLLSQAIYILPALRIDTNIDHIYGHINPYKNGHYGYFVENGHYGLT